jgi:biopolymer transport protein TolR
MGMVPTDPSGGQDGYRPLSEINVTPLVDVMLVLLIIFMVAAPMMTVGVPVDLPKTQAAKPAEARQPLVVSIDRDGNTFLGEEAVAQEALAARLGELSGGDLSRVVYVRGDRSLAYGRIMDVMGRVSAAGFAEVSLIAHGRTEGGEPAR